MNRTLLFLIVLATSVATVSAAQAKTFIVYDFDAGETSDRDVRVMSELLRSEMEEIAKTYVKEAPDKTCYSVSCAKQTLQSRGVDAVVIGTVMILGSNKIIMVKAVWDSKTYRYKVPLENPEDFEYLAERLATAIVGKTTFDQEMGMDSVAKREQDPNKRKVHGDFSVGAGLGVWKPLGDSYLGADYLYMFTAFLRYELTDIAIDLESGIYYSNSVGNEIYISEVPIDVSVLYYFSKRDRSPFIGGTFGIHMITLKDDSDVRVYKDATYWAPHFGGFLGYELGRAQVLSFSARVGYKANLVSFEKVEGALEDEDVGEGAHGPFFAIAITFF